MKSGQISAKFGVGVVELKPSQNCLFFTSLPSTNSFDSWVNIFFPSGNTIILKMIVKKAMKRTNCKIFLKFFFLGGMGHLTLKLNLNIFLSRSR